jgi:hypothetical protein
MIAGVLLGVLCFFVGRQMLRYDSQYQEFRKDLNNGTGGPVVTSDYPEFDPLSSGSNSQWREAIGLEQSERDERFHRFRQQRGFRQRSLD